MKKQTGIFIQWNAVQQKRIKLVAHSAIWVHLKNYYAK